MMTSLPLPAAKIERSGLWNLKTHTEIRGQLGHRHRARETLM